MGGTRFLRRRHGLVPGLSGTLVAHFVTTSTSSSMDILSTLLVLVLGTALFLPFSVYRPSWASGDLAFSDILPATSPVTFSDREAKVSLLRAGTESQIATKGFNDNL